MCELKKNKLLNQNRIKPLLSPISNFSQIILWRHSTLLYSSPRLIQQLCSPSNRPAALLLHTLSGERCDWESPYYICLCFREYSVTDMSSSSFHADLTFDITAPFEYTATSLTHLVLLCSIAATAAQQITAIYTHRCGVTLSTSCT